ncbi:MAG: hypothetical protein GX628_00080 [Clostridiales bacterium]|nr:hypothetical protein [Clostridiales bacterium]
MLNSEKIKELALAYGADVVGITSMDRFEGAPQQMDPRYAMPRAKSMVVFGYRIFRGALRGVEEGTFFGSYSTMCYGYINQKLIPWTARQLARIIEDEGYETMPLGYHFYYGALNTTTGKGWKDDATGYSVPVAEGLPRPDTYMSMRIAAFLAGLGEIGYSKVFLNPIYGPRLRFACMMTDLELEPDPIMQPGTLCNRCMACANQCPGHSISKTETVKVNIAGYDLEWAKIDESGCNTAFVGAEVCEEGEEGNYLNPRAGKQFKPSFISPYYRKPANQYSTGQAICGGRGCMRACMISLEARGVISNKFDKPFRRRPQWSVDWDAIRAQDAAEDTEKENEVT